MTVNHDVVGSSPTGGVERGRKRPIFFCILEKSYFREECGKIEARYALAPLAQLDRVPDYESGG